jgi:hypothetical protein
MVCVARFRLAQHLIHEHGADVYRFEMPVSGTEGKLGIDDLLARIGPDKVLDFIGRAKQTRVRRQSTPQAAVLSRLV